MVANKNGTVVPAIFHLGGYTTIMSQSFSPDGQLLVAASDAGIVAVFKTKDLAALNRSPGPAGKGSSDCCLWTFDIATAAGEDGNWSIQSISCGPTDVLFIGACNTTRSLVLGFKWTDLAQKKLKVVWRMDSNLLPIDINSVVSDPQGATHGRLFVGGGGGNGSQGGPAGGGVRVFDIETSQEERSSLKGHEDYIHDMDYCPQSNALVSASEDGTARIWDIRTKKAQVQVIKPSKHEALLRPKVGNWLGATSISGDWLALGGGPRAALWHLRTLTPMEPYLPPEAASANSYQGGIHALHIFGQEQKIVTGGDLEGTVYLSSMTNGQILSEIPTTFKGTTYSVAFQTEPFKMMAIAGSSANIDLCTGNFDYKDTSVKFPS